MSNYILIDGTLYHHGIKGQKWGERRYQNEDGSLTPEGREHYGYGQARERYLKSKDRYTELSERQYLRDKLYGGFGRITKKGRELSKDLESARSEYRSSKSDYKRAKFETKRDEDVKAVKEYRKAWDKADKIGNQLDEMWERGESYSKKYKDLSDKFDKLHAAAKVEYKKTGRNFVERVYNNIKYEKTPEKLKANSSDSAVTKRVKSDYNNLTAGEFRRKYGTDKDTYAKRVEKYGDPYARRTSKKQPKPKKEKTEYEKGLTRATIEGGLIGRAIYKKKHSN